MKYWFQISKYMTILLISCICVSCAIEKPKPCYRNGVAYGVSDGSFRGKWWNYYQVGLSFTDGGFWQEACNAFEKASMLRKSDKKWASTYGVRHINYFPHREFGIALYYMGQYQKAFKKLNQSIIDEPTGRAIYYLNLVKKAQTAFENKDNNPPKIVISSPKIKYINDYAVLVSGIVKDDTYIEKISINNKEIRINEFKPEISFETSLNINAGKNTITIQSTDVAGNKNQISTDVFVDIQSPAYSITSINPIALNGIHVKGTFFDNIGLQSISIQSQGKKLFTKDIHGQPFFSLDQKILSCDQNDTIIKVTDISGNETQIDLYQKTKMLRSFNKNNLIFGQIVNIDTQKSPLINKYLYASASFQAPIILAKHTGNPKKDILIEIQGFKKNQTIYFNELLLKIKISGSNTIKSVTLYHNGEAISSTSTYIETHSLGTNYCLNINFSFTDGENILKVVADNGKLNEQSFIFHKKELELDDSNMTVAMIPSSNNEYNDNIELTFLNALKNTERFNLLIMKNKEEAVQAYQNRSKSLIDYIDEGETQPPLWVLEWSFESREFSKPVRIKQEKSKIEISVDKIGEFKYEGDANKSIQMQKMYYFDIKAKLIDLDDKNNVLASFESYDENQDSNILSRLVSQLVSMQIIDQFPKVTGVIKKLIKNKIYIMPGKNKGVKKGMRLVIFRTTPIKDELTDDIIDQDIEIIEEAIVRKVKKKGFFAILRNKKNLDRIAPLDRVMTR